MTKTQSLVLTLAGIAAAAAFAAAYGLWPSAAVAPGPATGSEFILNEIRISGEGQFVELKNVGAAGASPSGLRIAGSADVELPAAIGEVAPGEVVVVRFDGSSGIDGTTVHASRVAPFEDGGGTVLLRSGERLLDHAAWGGAPDANIYLGAGGRGVAPLPGSVIARPSTALHSADGWNFLGPADGSPGGSNPAAAVTAFATPGGAIFLGSAPVFSWYHVLGASSYAVEIASEVTFASPQPLPDVKPPSVNALSQVSVTGPALGPGPRYWRVTARYPDGGSAISETRPFAMHTGARIQTTTASAAPGFGAAESAATPAADASRATTDPQPIIKRVEVMQIYQRKDTNLLHLLNPSESGDRAWDSPDAAATHARPYCAPAALAMVADFFGGRVSVDRFRYEAFKNDSAGPETDLQETGFFDPETNRAAAWAFSPAPAYRQITTVAKIYEWMQVIRQEIDAGRPLMSSFPTHMFLIVGYTEDGGDGHFAFMLKDGNGEEYLVSVNTDEFPKQHPDAPLRRSGVDAYWIFDASTSATTEEASVLADGDGDQVADFDEIVRFQTSAANPDSDADGVGDKQEIRNSTWDPAEGYRARSGTFSRRDHDRDELAMELDPDSDGGGCLDGFEDRNYDGHHEQGHETSGFNPGDDGCVSGTFLARTNRTTTQGRVVDTVFGETRATFSLEPVDGGRLRGVAAITSSSSARVSGGDPCALYDTPLITRSWQMAVLGESRSGVLQLWIEGDVPDIKQELHGCGGTEFNAPHWPGFFFASTATFTDGRYDTGGTFPLAPNETGEHFWELHMRQPRR